MASISKLSRDKRKKNAPYYVQFTDHEGRRRTTKGCSDRGVTQAKAAKIETVVQQIKLGLADVAELDALLGRAKAEGLEPHLAAFKASLTRKKTTEKHVNQTDKRIRLVMDGIGFKSLDELNADAVEAFLSEFCEESGYGHRTYNHYLQAIDSFGNWLASPARRLLDRNPFAGIPRRNAETDVRHKRRALSPEEIALVVKTARESTYRSQCYDGETRARIYLLSYMTGLRKSEIASLTPASFDLDGQPATLTVEAAASKHRRRDTLPLHTDLSAMVRTWLVGLATDQPLFPKLAKRRTSIMMQRDLKEAGIPYWTEDGVADFHAAGRHTHITGLLKSGVSLVEAKELARHRDVKMTMQYAHIGLDDQAKAVNRLPGLDVPNADTSGECLHIVCTESGADGPKGAQAGADRRHQSGPRGRQNPAKQSVFGSSQQPVTRTDRKRQKAEGTGLEPATG